MTKRLLPCFFLFVCLQVQAQLGFTVTTTFNSSREWQVVVENYVAHRHFPFLHYGTAAAVDYSFGWNQESIRIKPALQFMRTTVWFYPHYFEVSAAGVQCNFDFALIPASKNDGGKQAFRPYFQFSPGLDRVNMRYDLPVGDAGEPFKGEYDVIKKHNFAFNAGAALLLEFQLSQLLSFSPEVGVRFYPKLKWDGFTDAVSGGKMSGTFDRTNWRQYHVGIRMGLNLSRH